MTSENDSLQRVNDSDKGQLSKYNEKYGIPYKTLISKALKYAFDNPEQVWGVK